MVSTSCSQRRCPSSGRLPSRRNPSSPADSVSPYSSVGCNSNGSQKTWLSFGADLIIPPLQKGLSPTFETEGWQCPFEFVLFTGRRLTEDTQESRYLNVGLKEPALSGERVSSTRRHKDGGCVVGAAKVPPALSPAPWWPSTDTICPLSLFLQKRPPDRSAASSERGECRKTPGAPRWRSLRGQCAQAGRAQVDEGLLPQPGVF